MVSRSEAWWRLRLLADSPKAPGSLFRAVLSNDGADAAYALYRVKSQWEGGSFANEVDVVEAVGSSAQATREIWRYLFALDLVAVLRAGRLPVDHPLALMLQEPRRMRLALGDALWCRILDAEAALAGRALGKGSVVLELADDFLPGNTGRWRIGEGGATRTEEEPDLALAVAELGSVYLGGFTFGELVRAGQVRELRPGGAARGDEVLYAARAPWCPEIF
ncbi:MAG: sterol carrier protein domain-containing protein [Gaiellaceae bacterium]